MNGNSGIGGTTQSVRRRCASWNVGGQSLTKVDAVAGEFDILLLQEIPRSTDGWGEDTTESFSWLSHQSSGQWRGVAIGISQDIYDSWTDRVSFDKGAAWLIRLKSNRRLVLGSIHLPTGVSTATYHAAVQDFKKALRSWHPDLPCCIGVDVNEVVKWTAADEGECNGHVPLSSGAKLDKFLEAVSGIRLRTIPPRMTDRWKPTHYPRDISREGRHIDAVLTRLLSCSSVTVIDDVRFHINTDHARIEFDIEVQCTQWGKWHDSRPRWVNYDGPLPVPHNWDDMIQLGKDFTAPRRRVRYHDPPEVVQATAQAKTVAGEQSKAAWQHVHQLRRRFKRRWQKERASRVLGGDWFTYRDIQAAKKRRNWWGRLLHERSSIEVAEDVTSQLTQKVWDAEISWDEELRRHVQAVSCDQAPIHPITCREVCEALIKMKPKSSVGPDGVSVDLIKRIFEEHPDALCELLTDVLFTGNLPPSWGGLTFGFVAQNLMACRCKRTSSYCNV